MTTQLSDDSATHVVLDAENPWPGLDFFNEESCGFFHGRVEEANLLLSMVRHRLLTVLYGQSGLGKSSLLQAGLFPRLRADGRLPVYIRLSHTDTDGLGGTGAGALIAQARQAIREAMADALETGDFVLAPGANGESPSPFPRDDETLWQFLHRQESGLRTRDDARVSPVLVFDQFEEIFTLGRNERRQAIRRTFLRDLADCVENRLPAEILTEMNRGRQAEGSRFANLDLDRQDYRIVLSLREDYLAELHDLSELMPSVHENETRLVPLNGWQALDAVSIPGENLIDPVVAREVVEIVAATRRGEAGPNGADANEVDSAEIDEAKLEVDPALLSMVCRELNIERQRRNQAKITPQIVDDLLKHKGRSVLHRFYTECFALLPDRATAGEVQKFIEDDLLTPAGYRNMAELARAQQVLSRAGVPDPSAAIQQLINQRLLRVNERRQDKTKWLELTHDVLCDVVKESRHERELREAQEREERAEKERTARQLQEAERQRVESEQQAQRARENEAAAMAKLKQMRHQRRLGITALVLLLCFAGALVVAGILAVGKLRTGAEAQKESSKLVEKARAKLGDENNDRRHVFALRQLARALRIDPGNKDAAKMICTLLMEKRWCPPLSPPLHYPGGPLLSAAFTPQNRYVVGVSRDGNLVRWDARNFDSKSFPIVPVRSSGDNRLVLSSAGISKDGSRIVVGLTRAADRSDNARVFVWSEARAEAENPYTEIASVEFQDTFRSAAWSRDGNMLVLTLQRDRPSCRVFVLEGNIYKFKTEISGATAADISPDGRYLATGETGGRVQLLDTATLQPVADSPEFKTTFEPKVKNPDARVSFLTFSNDGQELAVGAMRESARILNLRSGESREIEPKSPTDRILRADYTSRQDGPRLAAGMTGMVGIWDTAKLGAFLAEPMCVHDAFVYPTFSSDGQKLITLAGTFWMSMGTVRVWDTSLRDAAAGAQNRQFDGKRAPAWLPDLADAVTGREEDHIDDDAAHAPTFSELRREYAGVPFADQYRPLWDRFLISNPGPTSSPP